MARSRLRTASSCLPLATLDVTLQLENTGIIRQGLGGDFQFGQSAVIIEVASIKVLGACEMCFTRIWTEAKCRLQLPLRLMPAEQGYGRHRRNKGGRE